MIMAGVGETLGGSSELPAGMWFYAFMFGDARSSVPDFVSSKRLPVPSSLVIGMAVGMGLTAVRLLLDFVVFKPLARKVLGFPRRRKHESSPLLDALCSKCKILSPDQIEAASTSTGLSAQEVRDYASAKRVAFLQDKQLNKFKEAAWRLVVYLGLVSYALKVSFGKPWFKDPFLVWENWPAGDHVEELQLYYHCAMGVYWHFIIFQFYDTRRSDFGQMLIHHVATLFLLTYSWLMSLVRIGTLIMLCHDVSDIFMESAKLFNYAQKRHHWCHLAADGFFFMFAAVFGTSRLYIYPKYMVLNVWQTTALSQEARLFFCGLLSTLLVLHVFWFYLILRMVYMFIFHGVEEDIRSDNDEGGEDDHSSNGRKKGATNGNGNRHVTDSKAKES